jgi:hypothetical protein
MHLPNLTALGDRPDKRPNTAGGDNADLISNLGDDVLENIFNQLRGGYSIKPPGTQSLHKY